MSREDEQYPPMILCACGFAVHSGEAQAEHVHYWHSEESPAVWRMATKEEHDAVGWNTDHYPEYIT